MNFNYPINMKRVIDTEQKITDINTSANMVDIMFADTA